MFYENIEFFNVFELKQIQHIPGLRITRFPDNLINRVGLQNYKLPRLIAQHPTGCEIRFVTDSPLTKVTRR